MKEKSNLENEVKRLATAMERIASALEDLTESKNKKSPVIDDQDEKKRHFELFVLMNAYKLLGESPRKWMLTGDVIDPVVQNDEELQTVKIKVGKILRAVSIKNNRTNHGYKYLVLADLVNKAIEERKVK